MLRSDETFDEDGGVHSDITRETKDTSLSAALSEHSTISKTGPKNFITSTSRISPQDWRRMMVAENYRNSHPQGSPLLQP